MNELDPRARVALELARTDSEPSAADKLRIFEALRARLGAPPIVPPTGDRSGSSVVGEPGASALVRSSAPLGKLIAVGVIAAGIGFGAGAGFGAGFGLRERAPGTATPAASATSVAAPLGPSAISAQAAPASAEAPVALAEPAVAAAAKHRSKRSPGTPSASEPELFEALNLLRRAQRALRKDEALLALALLDELDRHFAAQVLSEERQATRALALCKSGDEPRARETASALLRQNPSSIYAARLRESCAGEQSPAALPNTRQ
jgi:hypothetical protein